jgi:hypothetical protein
VKLVLSVLAFALGGCVSGELAGVERAKRELEACLAAHGEDAAECEPLAERKRQAEERYEGNARRNWGCDPTLEAECPTPR